MAEQVERRPYQEDCLKTCLEELAERPRRIGVSLPTGSGKTAIFLHLLERTLVIVSSVELAQQTAEQARRLFPHWTVEIEQGEEKATGLADITVATIQTLSRPGRLRKFNVRFTKAIIVDEAHHAAAESYRHVLAHFNCAIDPPDGQKFVSPAGGHQVPIIGFSATFSRFDGLALASVFEDIVYHLDVVELTRQGWLCNLRFTTVQAKMGLGQVSVNKRTGDYHEEPLARVLNTDSMVELVVRAWKEKASHRKSTVVFCVNLAHVAKVTEAFCAAGVDARAVSSKTPAARRAAFVTDFKAGKFPVLVNCSIFTEGTDIPNIDCVVIARPTQSSNLLSQMVGRGMRQSRQTGKEDCLVIDFADSKCHVAGLLSAPKFFGKDPAELDRRRSPNLEIWERAMSETDLRLEELRRAGRVPVVVYVDEANPFDLPDQASGDSQLPALSWNNWIYCGEGPGFYVLETPSGGTFNVSLVPNDGGVVEYVAQYSPYQHATKDISTNSTLGEAIRQCDNLAVQYMGAEYDILLRAAPSRWGPASDTQKTFIRERLHDYAKLRERDGKPLSGSNHMQEIEEMTNGTAENIVSRISHEAPTWKEYYENELLKGRQDNEPVKQGMNDHFDWDVNEDDEDSMWDYYEDEDRPRRGCWLQ
ncbi:P-loop containing nucleoside triphosphate hydrolase protein [Lentinus brumalis]|uniref:P-loop containing nucleoside triphosphate hydrolase protein n=1 Tax=Lentinus brumalis TaxID=2498619 RepID=A0A371CL35_9APHY|nr:P-loop containing nucleoside triphosphate hydrolase protein [Polyporus brumalis]